MSDPVTNAEVEDVLSSIRRLVSEDKRPVQAPLAAAKSVAEPLSTAPKSDRLVLTPALRVTETSDIPTDQVASSKTVAMDAPTAVEPTPKNSEVPHDVIGGKDDIAIDSLIIDDTPFDMTQSHSSAGKTEDVPEVDHINETSDLSGEDDHLFGDPAQDYSTDPYNFDDDTDSDGESDDDYLARIEVAGRGLSDDFEDEEADAFEAVSQTAILMDPETEPKMQSAAGQADTPFEEAIASEEATTEAARSEVLTAEAKTPEPSKSETPEAQVKAAALTAKIAALETAIGQIAETWEPDDAGESDYAGSEPEAMAWEDEEHTLPSRFEDRTSRQEPVEENSEPEVEASASQTEEFFAKRQPVEEIPSDIDLSVEDRAEDANHDVADRDENQADAETAQTDPANAEPTGAPIEERLGYSEEDQLIDEEALRDLVSDIVRQELQGALGERITRNVRKLVRREIHRALAAQDLE